MMTPDKLATANKLLDAPPENPPPSVCQALARLRMSGVEYEMAIDHAQDMVASLIERRERVAREARIAAELAAQTAAAEKVKSMREAIDAARTVLDEAKKIGLSDDPVNRPKPTAKAG